MKLRYRILVGLLAVIGVALAALALTVSHDTPCPPPTQAAEGKDTMRAVMHRCYGAASDALAVENVEKPVPAMGELLVRVHSAGVNPLDWHTMRGSPYLMRLATGIGAPANPRIGTDFAGTV